MLSQHVLPRKAAASAIMDTCCGTAHAFAMMQGPELLTLIFKS
jgi:hypothetical protein